MTTAGKWIDLRDGGELEDEIYVDCVIVMGDYPPRAEHDRMGMHCCTVVPSGGPLKAFYRRADEMNRVRRPVHEPEVLWAKNKRRYGK